MASRFNIKVTDTSVTLDYRDDGTYMTYREHAALCAALRRDKRWIQVSQMMGGGHKGKCVQSCIASRKGKIITMNGQAAGYGGHQRAVQGFKMTKARADV